MIVQCHLISFNNYNSSYFKEKGKYRYFNHSPSSDSMSRVFLTLTIRHLHISHNTFCFTPQSFAEALSSISFGRTVISRRNKKQRSCKIWAGGGGWGGQNKLRYGCCVNFEWLNKAIIQSGWGEGYQLFLAARWYFRLILRAKVKCVAAVSFVKNFVKFFPVALFQTNRRDIYKAVESAGTVSANREQGFQSLIPWIFLFWSISIFLKNLRSVNSLLYRRKTRPSKVAWPN